MVEILSIHGGAAQAEGGGWPPGVVTSADRERFGRYREALEFYEGQQWLGRRRRGETRLTVNYARTLIHKVASYIFPDPVSFTVPAGPEGQVEAAGRAELVLAEVIAELDLARLDVGVAIDAMVLGDAAIKVSWNAKQGKPVVAAVDPASLVVQWAPDDPRQVHRVVQTYGLTGEQFPGVLGMPAPRDWTIDPARVYPVAEIWSAERWQVTVAGKTLRDEVNPYGWIPYLVLANDPRPHCFWGTSDLVDLFDVCRELNARLSVLSRVLELSGAPIAVLENVDGSEGITVGPGAKWELPEGAKAYLLDLLGGGGVQLHIEFVNVLYRALHDLSETPRTAFGDGGRDLSGAALEVEVQPLVQKVGRKRRAWDALYRARNGRLLDLLERFGGLDCGGLRRTESVWPAVLPSDTEAAVRQAVSLVQSGIQSRRSAVAGLGEEDPDAELRRIAEEAELLSAAGRVEVSS